MGKKLKEIMKTTSQKIEPTCVCVLVTQLCLTLATPWTVAHWDPPSVGFSRQEYWSRLPFPSPNRTNEGIESIKKNQIAILELKIMITKIKNSLEKFSSKFEKTRKFQLT